jgi:hypothetical protein
VELVYFLGRFHVLALHVPIGLLLVAALADALSRRPRFRAMHAALPFLWGVGAVSASVTVALGYMHFAEGGFEGASGDAHRLAGTGLAIASIGLWLIAARWRMTYLKVRTLLIVVVVALVVVTGHYGGNLTHGASYLFGGAASADPRALPAAASVPDAGVVQTFLDAGFAVRPVSQSDPRLVVHASFADGPSDAQLEVLDTHGALIVDLSLTRSRLDDAALARFAGSLTQVAQLRLDNNALGDAGIASLAGLEALEALNLYGNAAVGDASIESLAGLPSLERVYVWGTGLTEAGRARLGALRPDLDVHAGVSAP